MMTLSRGDDTLFINNRGWRGLIHLGLIWGWRPAKKTKRYLFNNCESVTAKDAGRWADSLEAALRNVPDDESQVGIGTVAIVGGERIPLLGPPVQDTELGWLFGNSRQFLHQVINWLRAGEFEIC